ncbi:hypothetical protein [Rummeliibacillus pycnus]|uniref:hypothetical protein n=1 Tax=Rummeliibacillus pycnus TaxID=101070 RepID=UPI0037CBB78C
MPSTNITIRYYNVFITKNAELTNIDFRDFLDYVIGINNRQKGEVILKKMKLDTQMRNASDRAFTIADYRIRKPKQGEKYTDEYGEIENDIFEQTNCVYQHTEKLFICEYNYYGAKINKIKEYFEEFLPAATTSTDPKWGIEFIELSPTHSIENMLHARDITKLNIKLNLTSNQIDIFRRNAEEQQEFTAQLEGNAEIREQVHGYLETTLQEMIRTRNLFGGAIRSIIFSKGKDWRNNPFHMDAIKTLLCYIDVESDLFENIIVSYTDRNGNKFENIDLKHSKVLSKNISCDGDSWEIITDAIEDYYYNISNRLGQGNHQNYPIDHILQNNEYPF